MAWRVLTSGPMLEVVTGSQVTPAGEREVTQVVIARAEDILDKDLSKSLTDRYWANDDYVRSLVEYGEYTVEEVDGEPRKVWVAKGAAGESDDGVPQTDEELVFQNDELKAQIQGLQSSLVDAQSSAAEKDEAIASKDNELAELKGKLDEAQTQVDQAQSGYDAYETQISELKGQVADLTNQVDELTAAPADSDATGDGGDDGDDQFSSLTGADLDKAIADAGINPDEGGSLEGGRLSADEKRAALREKAAGGS